MSLTVNLVIFKFWWLNVIKWRFLFSSAVTGVLSVSRMAARPTAADRLLSVLWIRSWLRCVYGGPAYINQLHIHIH